MRDDSYKKNWRDSLAGMSPKAAQDALVKRQFDALKQSGQLSKGWTFDQYKKRQMQDEAAKQTSRELEQFYAASARENKERDLRKKYLESGFDPRTIDNLIRRYWLQRQQTVARFPQYNPAEDMEQSFSASRG